MPIHQKTITVSPADDVYAWTKSGDSNGSWITITNAQNAGVDTDTWNFTVGANTGAQRAAVCTVTHSNGTTAESFTITQATGGSPVVVPTISTGAPSTIGETSMVLLGNEDNNGGEALTARGFKWGLAANALSNTESVTLSGGNGFFKSITGLTGATTYYAQAYGTNSAGEGTGNTVSATTAAAAPSLSFNSFSVEAQNNPDGINIPEPNPGTSFSNNAYITITSTNVPDGYYIPTVSITKIAPSASAGQYADFDAAGNSSLLIGSTINDLDDFTFSNDLAEHWLRVQGDNTTEGNETYRVTISPDYLDANDNVVGQHGLSTYVDFIILDNSISTATQLGYNNASNYGALGSPTTSTSGSTSFSTYTFNNSGGTYGPSHNILFKANGAADPVYNTSSTNTVNTFYWSYDSEGVTNDSAAINGNGSSCVVNSTAMNPNGQGGSGTGFLANNHGFILFSDGQGSGGLAPSPIGLPSL